MGIKKYTYHKEKINKDKGFDWLKKKSLLSFSPGFQATCPQRANIVILLLELLIIIVVSKYMVIDCTCVCARVNKKNQFYYKSKTTLKKTFF